MQNQPIQRIPVDVAGAPGVRYGKEPLTFGVPFAEGQLPAHSTIRAVDSGGRPLPIQTDCMTTWKKDLSHVKWLLVDVQRSEDEEMWLEYPVQDAGPEPESPVTTTEEDGLLTVDTGALRLRLRTSFERWRHREVDSPIAGCQIKGEEGWTDALHGPGLLLYMKDQHGNLYTSMGACPAPKVIVEEEGPLRVCVLVTGHLTSPEGVLFCPYRLRIHLYAGRADLRVFHTFVFDQDPTRIELSAIGMKVLARPGDGARGALGGEDDQVHWADNWEDMSLLQADDLTYRATRDGEPWGSGGKAPGWGALGGGNSSVVAAVRDFWQEYPKGFRIERDALEVGIWPEEHEEALSFLTPFDEPPVTFDGTRDEEEVRRLLEENPTAPLMLKSFRIEDLDDLRWVEDVMERLAPDREKTYCDFLGQSTGIGAAKTTEVVLSFRRGRIENGEAAEFGAAVQEPLEGIVDPNYLCGTDVFGPFQPAGHPEFVELDRHLTEIFEKTLIEPTERCRRYGMFTHGHMVNGHTMLGGPPTSDLVYHLYKDTDPEKALRYVGPFNNEAMDMGMGVWGQFLRTGDRRDLRRAQITMRAVADISFVHVHPGHRENVGCIHYHGAHAWSNDLNRSHSEVGSIMLDYYITGNRRMREVALEAADGILYDKLEPCGIVNCFSALHREFTGPLSVLMEAYQVTWDEKYGEPARRSLNWLLRTVRTPGFLPRSVYTRGPRGQEAVVEGEALSAACNPYHVFRPALRLFPSQALRDLILDQAEHGAGLVEAYQMTGDPQYAAAALAQLQDHKTTIEPDDVLCFYSFEWCDEIPRLMRIVALAAEEDSGGFREYARRWREEREASPKKAPQHADEQEPETSLGVLSTEPFDE